MNLTFPPLLFEHYILYLLCVRLEINTKLSRGENHLAGFQPSVGLWLPSDTDGRL